MLASMRDIAGGRSKAYEEALAKARLAATDEMVKRAVSMNANVVIGVDLDYEVCGDGGMMISMSGTAVLLDGQPPKQDLPPISHERLQRPSILQG